MYAMNKSNQNSLNQRIRTMNGSNNNVQNVVRNNITTTSQADCNIYKMPENQIPNVTNYMYDEKTILQLNTTSQNYCVGQYFNPCDVVTPEWNYCINNPKNLLAGQTAYSSSLGDMSSNIQNLLFIGSKPEGRYSLDITNSSTNSPNNGLFFSVGGHYTNSTSENWDTIPRYNKSSPVSNYLVNSQYIFLSEQDLLIVTVNISITGTELLYVNNLENLNNKIPLLSVIVKNKVYSRESLKNGGNTGGKTYELNSNLKYLQPGENFDNKTASYNTMQNIPLVFAPGFVNVNCYISVLYVPPYLDTTKGYVGQYLKGKPGTDSTGYIVTSDDITFDLNKLVPTPNQKTNFGHFVAGIAYDNNNNYSTYLVQGIQEEVLTTNIWRSPISLYNSYKNYSIVDTNGLSVTLLFSRSYNGGLYLVTNTGTPISSVVSYGILPLNNFINTMQAFCRKYDNTSSLGDYFIDAYTVKKLQTEGYDVILVQLQSVLDNVNTIKNPSNIDTLPNMNYFLLHRPNSGNISVDPNEQVVINQNTGQNYFGLGDSTLFSLGDNVYTNSKLSILSTFNNTLFGNSIYLGLQDFGGLVYHVIFTLPESAFRPDYCADSNIVFNAYATLNTAYYVTNSSGFTRFVPNAIRTNVQNQPSSVVSKCVLTVSNNVIF